MYKPVECQSLEKDVAEKDDMLLEDKPKYIKINWTKLDAYLTARAIKFQKINDFNRAFESLYLITCINRGDFK